MLLAFEFVKEPGAGMGPIIVSSPRGYAENLGSFLESEADKVAQLDQFSFVLVLRRQLVERFVDGEQLVVLACGGQFRLLKSNALLPATMTNYQDLVIGE